MAHTHELASQICDVIKGLSFYMKINVVLAVGGIPRHQNAREMRTAHVVVGTPGRIWDLASGGDLKFADLRMFVLDEADEMLRDRFAEQVNEIVNIGLPPTCQVAFFSATMPPEVKELADKILRDPVRITLRTADVKLEGIKQYVVELVEDGWKLPTFLDIYQSLVIPQSIIFVNTKERAEWVHSELAGRGFPVSVIYGEPMPQSERQKRMKEFRDGTTRVLIATNLLARGIDVTGRQTVDEFKALLFQQQVDLVAQDLQAHFWQADARVVANSFGAYLFLHAQIQLAPFPGKVLLLSPIVGESTNETTATSFVPPRAALLFELASNDKYPTPLNCEMHVGSLDWQCNPENVQKLAGLINLKAFVVDGAGHSLPKSYVGPLLDKWLA
jgi:hypothetical protein